MISPLRRHGSTLHVGLAPGKVWSDIKERLDPRLDLQFLVLAHPYQPYPTECAWPPELSAERTKTVVSPEV